MPLVVQHPDHGEVSTSVASPAPFLEFSVDLRLEIPMTEIGRDDDLKFTIGMIQCPRHRITFHSEWFQDPPAWSRPAWFYDFFDVQWYPFAWTWEIKVRGPLWLAPMHAPVPTVDFSDSLIGVNVLAGFRRPLGEWVEYADLEPTPPGSHPFPADKRHNGEFESRIIRYYEENGRRIWRR